MAFLFDVERVLYQCSCESRYPLCRLYFCRYCVTLRCADCTQHEADVYFCPQCLQSHMAPEAQLYHMKCKTCFECPSCQCVLALRAVTTAGGEGAAASPVPASAADKSSTPSAPQKKYYLSCGNCHWTTRDAGYEDKELAALQNSFFDADQQTIKQLKEAYHLISLRDASERAARKTAPQVIRRKTMASLGLREDSSQLSTRVAQFSVGLTSLSRSRQLANVSASDVLQNVMSVASSSVEPLSDDYFTRPLDLTHVTSLEQRNRDERQQPSSVMEFRPLRKRLAIKKSIRCKQCDHSLCKPEYSTSNIKFKIQLLAQLQLPEVRIYPGYSLVADRECQVVLSVANPDQLSQCTFKLLPDNDNSKSTCQIQTPGDVVFKLEPKNEAFSLDDSIETDPDKEKFLAYNHGSKIGLKCLVSVPSDIHGKVIVCVVLHHTPLHTNSESVVTEQKFPIAIDLGAADAAAS